MSAAGARNIFETIPAAVVTTDAAERVTALNARAVALLGHGRDECVGQPLGRLVKLPRALREMACAPGSPARSFDVALARPPGEHVPLSLSVGVAGREGSGFACLLQTPHGTAGLDAHGLQHLERLVSMGQMVAGFAHEVRNPLAALKSLVENMVAEAPDADPRQEDLSRIDRLVRRIESLVRSSLQFGRPNEPLRQAHDAAALVSAALDVLAPRLRHAVGALVPEVEPGLPQVFVDDNQLVQVVIVLLNNAMDATERVADVSVRVCRAARTVGDDAAAPDAGDAGDDVSAVAIEVTDRGPGIAPEVRPRIFDPFFTTKPRGSGLGLAIARRLVHENRGQILVRSRPGVGTTFAVVLPAYAP